MLAQGEVSAANETLGHGDEMNRSPGGATELPPLRGLRFSSVAYPGLRGVFDPRSTLG